MKKLILHIPHSSTRIPDNEGYVVGDDILKEELFKLTDWYTDELFHSHNDIMVVADFSRIFCDPERFADDDQEVMAKHGMGVIYTTTDAGDPLREIDTEIKDRIIITYYQPHHDKFTKYVQSQLLEHDSAMIIDCHSFPPSPLSRDLNKDSDRPDFNLGTDPYHTPKEVIEFSMQFFAEHGHTLWIDRPYAGTMVPSSYYRKDKRVKSVMLEINRDLYLISNSAEKSDNFKYVKGLIGEYLKAIKILTK